jgi:nicotinamidase-related amidase
MAKRIDHDRCLGVIIDVQDFFLSQLATGLRAKMATNIASFARLLGYFRVPVVVTLERPIEEKGVLPTEIGKCLGQSKGTFEKDFFDLTKERKIKNYLGRLHRKQAIVVGCETDVCVLQSTLGLLQLGYEVFVVEDLLFSSARNVDRAIARMHAAGAVLLSYKSLYYELIEAVGGGRHAEQMTRALGPFPDDLPDCAAQ